MIVRARPSLSCFILSKVTRSIASWVVAVAVSGGCSGDSPRLFVDVVTDYTPDRHFSAVRTEMWSGTDGTDGVAIYAIERYVEPDDDFLAGARVAEVDSPPTGPATLRVTLLANDIRPIALRTAILNVQGNFGATVLITRDCAQVSCPAEEACQAGRCISAGCIPEAPDECEPPTMTPECVADADCTTEVPCAHARCVAGSCLIAAEDTACADGEICDETSGCVPTPACGDSTCDEGESYCECPTDCSDACGSGCCTGEDIETTLPNDIPDEPPPEIDPTGLPSGEGECVVVCCDGFTEVTTQPNFWACRDYYRNCRPHGRVETMHFEGYLLYERPSTRRCVYCCALCGNRLRFHRVVEVVSGCTVAAEEYCDTGTRGGLVDADWRDCPL